MTDNIAFIKTLNERIARCDERSVPVTRAQAEGWGKDFINALSPEQASYLPTEAFGMMSQEAISTFSTQQMNALWGFQIDEVVLKELAYNSSKKQTQKEAGLPFKHYDYFSKKQVHAIALNVIPYLASTTVNVLLNKFSIRQLLFLSTRHTQKAASISGKTIRQNAVLPISSKIKSALHFML